MDRKAQTTALLTEFVERSMLAARVMLRPVKATQLNLGDVDGAVLDVVEPVFVLSTGRCGTKWLTELLAHDSALRVNHSDHPELLRESRMAYERYAGEPDLFHEIVRTARDGYLLDAHIRGMRYVETNHRITFLAPAALRVYPRARFVHLVRNPGDFVRSGVRRRWYSGSYYDLARPTMADAEAWQRASTVERLAWLWNETQSFIEDFVAELPDSRVMRIRSEDMFSDLEATAGLCDFIGARIGRRAIGRMHQRRVNVQHGGPRAPFERWSAAEREAVRRQVPLAERYGYILP
ncbi:MAG: sulfotransferase [Myxococcales bacterium]|nr:sulfotransferase [Myxococcales bacterium]